MTLILNIDKKMRDLGYVRFINGQLLAGNNDVIDFVSEPGGGVSGPLELMIPVPAYASAPDGTGFTLTNSDALEYMAWAVLPLGHTPVANDFAAKWYHRKGLPGTSGTGTPGTDGQAAGFRVNWDSITTEAKPGGGRIRANNANPALATELYLDEDMPTGMDISGLINFMKDGMVFMMRPNANTSAPMFIYELTADPIDNGDWFTLAVSNIAASASTFTNGDECTFQFFGGGGGTGTVTEAAILAAGAFVRTVSNGAGGLKLKDSTNVDIDVASPVYKLASVTISGVSNLPAANTMPHGAVVLLHRDNLVGAGSNPIGVYVVADAVNNVWRPYGPQMLFAKRYGSIATPSLSLTAAGKFSLGGAGDPVIPGGLLHADAKLEFRADLIKTGTTQPLMKIQFGTDLTTRANNSTVLTQQFTATANMNMPSRSEVSFISATAAVACDATALGGGGAAGIWNDAATLINIASDMKATIEASTLTGDTVYLLGYAINWLE